MTVSMGDGDIDEIDSGCASWVRCAQSLQMKRKKKGVKIVSLILRLCCFVDNAWRAEVLTQIT